LDNGLNNAGSKIGKPQTSETARSGDAFDTEAKKFVCLVQMFGIDAERAVQAGLELVRAVTALSLKI
jgi:hypothetical protein